MKQRGSSPEAMERNVNKNPSRGLFDRLKAGLEDGIAFARGNLTLRTSNVPSAPPSLGRAEVLQLRTELRMSQGLFARTLNVSIKTVQSWEQGERRPSRAALRLLQILRNQPEVVAQLR